MTETILKPTHACPNCGATVKDSDDICPYCFASYSFMGNLPKSVPNNEVRVAEPALDAPHYVTWEEIEDAHRGISGGVLIIVAGLALSLYAAFSIGQGEVTIESLQTASNLQIVGSLAVLGGVFAVFAKLRAWI
jgi:hypothetical protein